MMLLLLLARRKSLPFFSVNHLFHRSCFSDSSTQTPHFIVDFLITSCAFSLAIATKISRSLAHLKSAQNPASVLHFLKHRGFTDANIQTLIRWHPKILCSSPGNTLEPHFHALGEMGLSSSTLTQLVVLGPTTLILRSAVPRIQFWRDFLGGDEATLLRAFKYNRGLAGRDIGRDIAPKMALLQSHGLSTDDIRRIVLMITEFISISTSTMEDRLKRTKELGFQPGSGMFVHGLHAVSGVSREVLLRKMELLKSFGWSEDEFFLAVRKAPKLLMPSGSSLRMKMDFLMREVGCVPSYIASHPLLLQLSLEKRLRPRHHVMRLLESKGLLEKRMGFYTLVTMPNRDFAKRYMLPHKEEISGLHGVVLENEDHHFGRSK